MIKKPCTELLFMNFRKGHKHVFKNVNTTEGKKKKKSSHLNVLDFFPYI